MKTSEFISEMEDLLRPKNGWTKGTSARDKKRRPVFVANPEAVSFCLVGSINKVQYNATQAYIDKLGTPEFTIQDYSSNLDMVYECRKRIMESFEHHGILPLANWNDSWFRTKKSVMKKLDEMKREFITKGD